MAGSSSGVWEPRRKFLCWTASRGDIGIYWKMHRRDRRVDTIGLVLARLVKRCLLRAHGRHGCSNAGLIERTTGSVHRRTPAARKDNGIYRKSIYRKKIIFDGGIYRRMHRSCPAKSDVSKRRLVYTQAELPVMEENMASTGTG